MAVDMFVKIGALKGEAQDDKHKDEIDVIRWSWGLHQTGTGGQGGGSGAGKVSVSDLQITKPIDKSTPDLALSCANGKHFDKAIFTVRRAGEHPLEYLVITMEEVLISSISIGGGGNDEILTENVNLNFSKVKVDYKEQTKTGGAGASPTMTWDIKANKSG